MNGRPFRGILVVLLTALVTVQPCASALPDPRSRDELDLKALLESAESLRIEFRADIQLSAIEAGRLSRQQAEQLLERLFRDAPTGRHQYKQRDIFDRANTRERKLARAFSLNLDTLSIRHRVVRAMLPFNAGRARDLFDQIRLEVPRSPCSAGMVYDVAETYDLARAFLNQPHSGTGAGQENSAAILENHLRRVTSPVQLAPLANLLVQAELDRGQFMWLSSILAESLHEITATDRELTAVEADAALGRAIGRLTARHGELGQPVLPLLQAYRGFLLRSAREERCADNSIDRGKLADSFNQLRDQSGLEQTLKPLLVEELLPQRIGGKAHATEIGGRTEFLRLLDRVMTRREIALRRPGEDPELASAGWESDVAEFMASIDALDPARAECRPCAFHEKADLYFIFFDLVPAGHLKLRILNGLVEFLANDTMQEEAPLEWLFRVKLLLNLSRKPSEEQLVRIRELERQGKLLTMLPSDAAKEISATMKNSGAYLLYLYVAADKLLGREYEMPPY
jgi:hypothetical protein